MIERKSNRGSWFVSSLLLAGLLAAGCGKTPAPAPEVPPRTTNAPRHPQQNISTSEIQAFAATFIKAVHSRNNKKVCALLDWPALIDISAEGTGAPERIRAAFLKGARHSVDTGKVGFAADLTSADARGATLRLLRTQCENGRATAVIRLLNPDGSVNYFELVLAREPDRSLRIEDIYMFLSGEYASDTFRRAIFALLQNESRGLLERLTGKQNSYVASMPKLQEMRALVTSGQPQEALEIYKTLPAEIKKDRSYLIVRLWAAQMVGDDEYVRAINDFARYFDDDARIDLVLIDGFVIEKQYQRALECIDEVDKDVGGDPYLNTMRANLLLKTDQVDKARAAARAAVKAEPNLVQGHWALVAVALHAHEFDNVLRGLEYINQKFHAPMKDLATVPEYAEFVKSPQYKTWLSRHPRKAASRARTKTIRTAD